MVDHKLNLNDNLGVNDKTSIDQVAPEQIKNVEQQIVTFLLSLQKQLTMAKQIVNKLGLAQLGISLNASAESIEAYLKEYNEQKAKKDGQKTSN
jgi:hypothetical protein